MSGVACLKAGNGGEARKGGEGERYGMEASLA